jgi:peroxiredoxin
MISFKHLSVVLLTVIFSVVMLHSVEAATEAQAKLITGEFDRSHRLWQAEMQLAQKTGVADQVAKKRPDAREYANRLKVLISRDLAKEWTLNYGAWLLENDSGLKPESQRALLAAVEKHHTLSPRLGRFCMALIYLNQGSALPRAGQPPVRSRGMHLLKTVKKNNPDPKVQGMASLSLSMMLASLGDDPRVMKERIENLREAIIKSSEVRVGDLTVAKIAQDELYKIKNLSKGSVAPSIVGVDSASRPMQLTQFKGKVVILVFWSSWDAEAGRMLEILRNSVQAQAGKPIVVLGVNRDSITNLRALEADGLVTWRNFTDPKQRIGKTYRIASWPYCLVLDQKGVISYHGNVGSFADAVANSLLTPEK